jgi:hypothetical protein
MEIGDRKEYRSPSPAVFGDVPAAEKDQFIMDGVIRQRTTEHRRRRLDRREIAPAARFDIVTRGWRCK